MARGNYRTRRSARDVNRKVKKKPCILCRDHVEWVDYKDVAFLRRYMSDRGKIRARRVTGNCAQHQRDVAQAIKTAREVVLLPYTQRMVAERPSSRRGREAREREGARAAVVSEQRSSERAARTAGEGTGQDAGTVEASDHGAGEPPTAGGAAGPDLRSGEAAT